MEGDNAKTVNRHRSTIQSTSKESVSFDEVWFPLSNFEFDPNAVSKFAKLVIY